ncbi:MAG: hypothetical protein LQ338_005458 [Usnochroma carphineum]|nr:MAG: hypothetical protein LQ338_005458 [Usnochroma carphineum]
MPPKARVRTPARKVSHIDLTHSGDSSEPEAEDTSTMTPSAADAIRTSKPSAKKRKIQQLATEPTPAIKRQTMPIETSDVKDETNEISRMVTFHIGPKKKEWPIHRKLVCASSAIFETHFSSLDTKDQVKDMYLPSHDARAFGLFVDFLYRRSFPEIMPPSQQTPASAHPHSANLDVLLSLHFMGRDWALPDLQNLSLDHMIRYLEKASNIVKIYGEIEDPKAPLRRFAVDHFVYSVMKKTIAPHVRQSFIRNRIDIGCAAFIVDVFEAMINAKRYPAPVDPERQSRCVYHEHLEGQECTG